MNISTSCKDCVFATLNKKKIQTGCTLNRTDKLQVKEIDDGSFVLERFCNTYRPQEWLSSLSFDESINSNDTVLQEIYPRIGYFVRLLTNETEAIQKLETTIESISKSQPSYVVVINDKVEYNEEIWGLFIKYFGEESNIKYHIIQMTESPEVIERIVDKAFTHAQNGWITVTSSGEIVPNDMLQRIHNMINIQMKQIIMIEPYDEFNGLTFPAYVFKFLNGNKTKIFNDEEKSSDSFIQKMKQAEERGNTKCIISWEEFNAS